jgi:ATP-dependent Lon protease
MNILPSLSEQPIYPLIPIREGIVFPATENVLVFGRPKSVNGINEAIKKDKKIVLMAQKNPNTDDPKKEELYQIGILVSIEKTVLGEKGEINALVKGLHKVKVVSFIKEEPYFEVKVAKIEEKYIDDEEVKAMVKFIAEQVKKAINLGKSVDFNFLVNILNVINPLDFSNQVAVILDLRPDERQKLLEENDLKNKLKKEIEYINREIKVLEIEQTISTKTQKKFEQGMKETLLREKMKTIEEELGRKEEDKDTKEYEEKIKKAKMPKNVEEKALKELKRLVQMSQFNPETSYIRSYLDWLVDLPWSVFSSNQINIKKAEEILNQDHYGLKKIKERILEYWCHGVGEKKTFLS